MKTFRISVPPSTLEGIMLEVLTTNSEYLLKFLRSTPAPQRAELTRPTLICKWLKSTLQDESQIIDILESLITIKAPCQDHEKSWLEPLLTTGKVAVLNWLTQQPTVDWKWQSDYLMDLATTSGKLTLEIMLQQGHTLGTGSHHALFNINNRNILAEWETEGKLTQWEEQLSLSGALGAKVLAGYYGYPVIAANLIKNGANPNLQVEEFTYWAKVIPCGYEACLPALNSYIKRGGNLNYPYRSGCASETILEAIVESMLSSSKQGKRDISAISIKKIHEDFPLLFTALKHGADPHFPGHEISKILIRESVPSQKSMQLLGIGFTILALADFGVDTTIKYNSISPVEALRNARENSRLTETVDNSLGALLLQITKRERELQQLKAKSILVPMNTELELQ